MNKKKLTQESLTIELTYGGHADQVAMDYQTFCTEERYCTARGWSCFHTIIRSQMVWPGWQELSADTCLILRYLGGARPAPKW